MRTSPPNEPGYSGIIERELSAIETLCRRFHVRRLDLFGSAADDRFDPASSDVDLLVEFDPMPPDAYAAYFGLHEALEALFGRDVDLVTEPALKNPYLRRRIASEKEPIFRKSSDLDAERFPAKCVRRVGARELHRSQLCNSD